MSSPRPRDLVDMLQVKFRGGFQFDKVYAEQPVPKGAVQVVPYEQKPRLNPGEPGQCLGHTIEGIRRVSQAAKMITADDLNPHHFSMADIRRLNQHAHESSKTEPSEVAFSIGAKRGDAKLQMVAPKEMVKTLNSSEVAIAALEVSLSENGEAKGHHSYLFGKGLNNSPDQCHFTDSRRFMLFGQCNVVSRLAQEIVTHDATPGASVSIHSVSSWSEPKNPGLKS